MDNHQLKRLRLEAPEALPVDPEFLFRKAVEEGSAKKVQEILESRQIVNINARYPNSYSHILNRILKFTSPAPQPVLASVLHSAAVMGHKEVVNILIEHGADVNGQDSNELTPLMWVAPTGRADMVKFLLEKGADPRSTSSIYYADALSIADYASDSAYAGDDKIIVQPLTFKYLLQYAGDDYLSEPFLLRHVEILEDPELVKIIVSRGGYITWTRQNRGSFDKMYLWVESQLDEYEEHISPLTYANNMKLPVCDLLTKAATWDAITFESEDARERIFTALCVFHRLGWFKQATGGWELKKYFLSKYLTRDVLKGAACVKQKKYYRNYAYLMDTIAQRCAKLFSLQELLAFYASYAVKHTTPAF